MDSTQPPALELLSPKQLTEILIKHYGIKEGLYELLVNFGVGTGSIKSPKGYGMPGLVFGLETISIIEVKKPSESSVDASKVSSKRSPSVRAKK